MIEENNIFQQKSACDLPECMSMPVQHTWAGCLPVSEMLSATASMPGSARCGVNYGVNMTRQALPFSSIPQTPSNMEQACGVKRLHSMEKKCRFMNIDTGKTTCDALSGSLLKGFHIFDKSGSETRLIYSSVYPNASDAIPVAATAKLASFRGFQDGPLQPFLPKTIYESQIDTEENEMQEDTEEIDALLYSSEEESDSCSEDDEIKSTDRSPIPIKRSYNSLEQGDEMVGEVSSSDWRRKRQKQLKGAEVDPSLSDTASSLNLEGPHQGGVDGVSSHTNGQNYSEKLAFILDKRPSKKDSVRLMLKMLEGVIPGAKGKEPLLVLDEAIGYLKTLKVEAELLGVQSNDHHCGWCDLGVALETLLQQIRAKEKKGKCQQ